MTISTIAELIEQNEGREAVVYDDATGKPIMPNTTVKGHATYGVGHNGEKPLRNDLVTLILEDDIEDAEAACVAIFGALWKSLGAARQAALTDAAFTLGQAGLAKFEKMIAAIQIGEWDTAAAEMLASDWATQAENRVKLDAKMLLTGTWPA